MQVTKNTLISAFSNGKFPTGSDFENLIDSCYNDGSVVTSMSAVSATSDNSYTNFLSANSAKTKSLSADQGYVSSLRFDTITVDGAPGIDASLVVSLQPSGSAVMYFEKGILVELTVL